MLLAVVTIGDPPRTEQLLVAASLWTLILVIDGIVSFSYTIRPRKQPAATTDAGQPAAQREESVRP